MTERGRATDEPTSLERRTLEEKRADARRALDFAGRNVREWAVRDKLTRFTRWGAWKGGEALSLDEAGARRVVAFLKKELAKWGDQEWLVDDVLKPLAHYAALAPKRRGG